jgi:hypothetical protein
MPARLQVSSSRLGWLRCPRRMAAEISWARTHDRTVRTRPARETFLKRFEKEVDPDGTLPPEERQQCAEHAKRAYMLQLAKRSADVRKGKSS